MNMQWYNKTKSIKIHDVWTNEKNDINNNNNKKHFLQDRKISLNTNITPLYTILSLFNYFFLN